MPSPAAEHQKAQATLVELLVRELVKAWRLLQVDNLRESMPSFVSAVAALVDQYGQASGALAADFYDAERKAARIAGRFTPVQASPPDLRQVDESMRWATRSLWRERPDTQGARLLVQDVAERMVLDVGRNSIIDSAQHDRKAKGFARVTEPGACAFCLLLATRGAVYKSRESAGALGDSDVNRYHDHCRCHVVPVFTAYEPSAEIRHWQHVYAESTRNQSDKLNAFRRAVEQHRSDSAHV